MHQKHAASSSWFCVCDLQSTFWWLALWILLQFLACTIVSNVFSHRFGVLRHCPQVWTTTTNLERMSPWRRLRPIRLAQWPKFLKQDYGLTDRLNNNNNDVPKRDGNYHKVLFWIPLPNACHPRPGPSARGRTRATTMASWNWLQTSTDVVVFPAHISDMTGTHIVLFSVMQPACECAASFFLKFWCIIFVPRTFLHRSSQVIIGSCHHIDKILHVHASTRRAAQFAYSYLLCLHFGGYNLAPIFSVCSYISSVFFTSSVSVASLSTTTTLERKHSPDTPGPMSKISPIRLQRCRFRFNNETDVLQRSHQNKSIEIESKYQKPNCPFIVSTAFNKVSQSQDTCSMPSNMSTGKMSMGMPRTKFETASHSFPMAKRHSAKTWTRISRVF